MEEEKAIMAAVEFINSAILNSSSSSDEDEFVLEMLTKKSESHRVKNFIIDVIELYSEKEFKENIRVSRGTANFLIEKYASSSAYKKRTYKGGRCQLSPIHHILSFLWFCSNKNAMREVCCIFNMSLSTFSHILTNVVGFITGEVAPTIIKFPVDEISKKAIADDFAKVSGFPNVLGCIDCSYISIRTPINKIKSTYANRHDAISVTLQGICDSKRRFLDVFTGVPSKIHDSRIFKLSLVSKEIESICGSKYHLLGDSAYPIREYLLTPYRGNLSRAEKEFNLKFCQTRVIIENAFGCLKSRFRQLMRLAFQNVETAGKFILACCTLHNLCIDRQDEWILDAEQNRISHCEESSVNFNDDRLNAILKKKGEAKRDALKNLFSQ